MTLTQTAILLELLGFILASVTVALKYIQSIKRLLDSIKSILIKINDVVLQNKPDFESASGQYGTRVKSFYRNLWKLTLSLPLRWIVFVWVFLETLLRLKFRKIKTVLRVHRPALIFTLSLPLVLIFIIPWTLLTFFAVAVVKVGFIIINKLALPESVTVFVIIIGTLMALAGLIIEFILAF